MKYMKNIKYVCFLLMILLFSMGAFAQMECCPAPPYCVPTMACPLQMSGGQTEAMSNQTIQKISSAYEKVTTTTRSIKADIAKTRNAITSAVSDAAGAVKKGVSKVVEKAGQKLGLVEEKNNSGNEEDTKGVTQDNSHGTDITVEQRMEKNLTTYAEESKSDYASEYFTVERRKYIRQQATMTLMARMLMLKARIKNIKEIMDKLDNMVKEDEKKGSTSDEEGKVKPDNDMNENAVLSSNKELRIAWFQLLNYQKMIEAIKLEFAANQSISGMKLVKHVPTISSDGSVDVKTKGSEK